MIWNPAGGNVSFRLDAVVAERRGWQLEGFHGFLCTRSPSDWAPPWNRFCWMNRWLSGSGPCLHPDWGVWVSRSRPPTWKIWHVVETARLPAHLFLPSSSQPVREPSAPPFPVWRQTRAPAPWEGVTSPRLCAPPLLVEAGGGVMDVNDEDDCLTLQFSSWNWSWRFCRCLFCKHLENIQELELTFGILVLLN